MNLCLHALTFSRPLCVRVCRYMCCVHNFLCIRIMICDTKVPIFCLGRCCRCDCARHANVCMCDVRVFSMLKCLNCTCINYILHELEFHSINYIVKHLPPAPHFNSTISPFAFRILVSMFWAYFTTRQNQANSNEYFAKTPSIDQ